ncbi:hypothetical protein [Halobellus captivus]|uniref:hypothetical protein n=1 Tax=Halobellus captivus TaxID=2592614 RepID=UPI0011A86817|nr:hypothetical protein [Halobellus captivus]
MDSSVFRSRRSRPSPPARDPFAEALRVGSRGFGVRNAVMVTAEPTRPDELALSAAMAPTAEYDETPGGLDGGGER